MALKLMSVAVTGFLYFLAVMRCLLIIFFAVLRCSEPPMFASVSKEATSEAAILAAKPC